MHATQSATFLTLVRAAGLVLVTAASRHVAWDGYIVSPVSREGEARHGMRGLGLAGTSEHTPHTLVHQFCASHTPPRMCVLGITCLPQAREILPMHTKPCAACALVAPNQHAHNQEIRLSETHPCLGRDPALPAAPCVAGLELGA
jgi:hypothetical protein